MLILDYCLIFAVLSVSASAKKNESASCNTLNSLADALFHTRDNIFRLAQVFYPPRELSTTYLQVRYNFENEDGEIEEDENGEISDCSVTYLWALGGFLLIQPPSIFQFTSLFFYQKSGKRNSVTLTLPHDCRHLVNVSNSGSGCMCNEEENVLDILTHQVRKYIDPCIDNLLAAKVYVPIILISLGTI